MAGLIAWSILLWCNILLVIIGVIMNKSLMVLTNLIWAIIATITIYAKLYELWYVI